MGEERLLGDKDAGGDETFPLALISKTGWPIAQPLFIPSCHGRRPAGTPLSRSVLSNRGEDTRDGFQGWWGGGQRGDIGQLISADKKAVFHLNREIPLKALGGGGLE